MCAHSLRFELSFASQFSRVAPFGYDWKSGEFAMREPPSKRIALSPCASDLAELPGGAKKFSARPWARRGGALLRVANALAANPPLSAADVQVVGSLNGIALDERGGAIYVSDSRPVAGDGLFGGYD